MCKRESGTQVGTHTNRQTSRQKDRRTRRKAVSYTYSELHSVHPPFAFQFLEKHPPAWSNPQMAHPIWLHAFPSFTPPFAISHSSLLPSLLRFPFPPNNSFLSSIRNRRNNDGYYYTIDRTLYLTAKNCRHYIYIYR